MNKIQRPINNYDVAGWNAYYKRFPGMPRAVGADGDIDPDDPKVKEVVEAAVNAAVGAANTAHETSIAGLKKNSDTLLEENRQFKQKFEGVDLEAYGNWQKQMTGDEDAKLIAEGKVDEVVGKRTERMRTDYETRLNVANESTAEVQKASDGWKGRYAEERIGNALRGAAAEAGVIPEAMDDLIARGKSVFSVNSDGKVEARNEAGELQMSKDGKSVLGPKEFVSDLKELAPHYWPGSRGAGAQGAVPGGGGVDDLDAAMQAAAEKNDMTEYRRLKQKKAELKTGK